MANNLAPDYLAIVQRAVAWIAAHLNRPLELEPLRREASLGAFHFHLLFLGLVRETPVDLARRLRLERAAWRLAVTNLPVAEIAAEAGYEGHETFSQDFRVRFDATPTLFRVRKYPRIELSAPSDVHFQVDDAPPVFQPPPADGSERPVEVTRLPPMRLAALQHRGPYDELARAFEELDRRLAAAGEGARAEDLARVAVYHDSPDSPAFDMPRADAGALIGDRTVLPTGLVEQRVEPGRFAAIDHEGRHDTRVDTWARALGAWLPTSGHRLRPAPLCELFLTSPAGTAGTEPRSRVFIPLD